MKNPSSPLPATLVAALRYAIGIVTPIAVQRGWLGESDVANVSALVMAGATVLYGLWKTHDRQKRLKVIQHSLTSTLAFFEHHSNRANQGEVK